MVREYISWFENLDIYQEWVKDLPEPLCNAAFASAVFLGAAVFLLTAVINRILLVRWNARQRRARRRMEERRRQEAEEQRERDRHSREDREQMDLYLRFLMTAQMQNFTSLQGITFGQWKSQMLAEHAADGADRTVETEDGRAVSGTGVEPGDGINAGEGTREEKGTKTEETRAEDETGAEKITEIGTYAEECSTEWEKTAGTDAADGSGECGMEPGKYSMEPEEYGAEPEDAEAGQDKPVERKEPESGYIPEEEEREALFGKLGLPKKCVPDDAAGEAIERKAPPGSLRSVGMAAAMEKIRQGGDSCAAESLSSEQQMDFAKVLAQMREDAERQDYLERFRREKSEIIKNNLSVLERPGCPSVEEPAEGGGTDGKVDEEMERRKAAAREAVRQEGRIAQEKGKKKGMFGRRK